MDYIKRETILNALSELKNSTPFMTDKELLETVKKKVERIPAADVQEVKYGKWVTATTGLAVSNKNYYCSVCHRMTPANAESKCCPNCGAKNGRTIIIYRVRVT